MARDIYSRLNEIEDAALKNIAFLLERRGSHPQQQAIRQAYLDGLGSLGGLKVLDVGCGTGVVTRELARRVGPNGSVVGSDPTPGLIEVARQLATDEGHPGLIFEVQDGRALPYADASFDLVCAVTVLSHVPAREKVLQEIARVTRPGGRVLIVDGDFAANQLEHPDKDTTAKIVAAWRASTVDDPYLTHCLGPLLEGVGLRPRSVNGHVHIEAGRVDEATSFMWQWVLFAAQQAVNAGAITDAESKTWIEQVRDMNQRNLLFGSITFVSVICDRP